MMLGALGFSAPWLLLALAALPALWLILRAVPPAPVRRRFPGVALLLGLRDDEAVSDRTPWWLLALRMLAVGAAILGLAGPVLNPKDRPVSQSGPLLILLDGSWASARDWPQKSEAVDRILAEADRAGRSAAVVRLSDPQPPIFQTPATWRTRLPGLAPQPWAPGPADSPAMARFLGDLKDLPGGTETLWVSDGIDRPGRAEVLAALQAKGPVRVLQAGRDVLALRPVGFEDGAVRITALRASHGGDHPLTINIQAHGRDPAGTLRVLEQAPLTFQPGEDMARLDMTLPSEIRGRLTHFTIAGERSAGAVALTDDGLRRREVALIAGREDREGQELLSPTHYLEKALETNADLLHGALTDVLPANPDVVILADVATLSEGEEKALLAWIDKGGMLLRFAGPRLAASQVSRETEDPLIPVRLREGGRNVGGAMSWGEPKTLAPFPEDSPFHGLSVPPDVTVSSQVMAQPDPDLASRVIARLSDGTPLVTRKHVGQGQVVLFHVTANADWSNLPLSGLFVQMLERLSVSSATERPKPEELEGTTWQPMRVLDANGTISNAGTLPGVEGASLVSAPLGPELRPGLYHSEDRSLARNVMDADSVITPVAWPATVTVEGLNAPQERDLSGLLLSLALLMLLGDILASLLLSGRLRGARAAAMGLVLVLATALAPQARAQEVSGDDSFAIEATHDTVLAHVITGDKRLDDLAQAGLQGLSDVLFFRTSVEPGTPMAVDLEKDDLSLFPFLYWPISATQPIPSDVAYEKLNRYLRTGGLILFDTRDADIAGYGASSPTGRRLQEIARPLDIPPLEPIPQDHVLTRTFYLLQDFPGRYNGDIWVEAAPPDAQAVEGMPFRNLNDGVTPVVIGGNDWASAWAVDGNGNPMVPLGSGYAGERQREIAYRFGVNLIMHVLTGNYKSDQVHVPALLDRLGQ
ncbi:DUF4159 domain-containing protein [Pseudooceanicola sp. CBS1P-1]|nr:MULTISPECIES: DUF4159 domain-containing protein [Pseudooceanicola]MBT9384027.1 DUF4159 domain-containing protein [Pseudooceanicola endophyticus]